MTRLHQFVQRVLGPKEPKQSVSIGELAGETIAIRPLWRTYKLRWKRRQLLFRSYRKRRELVSVVDRTRQIRGNAILAFITVRNEAVRLPFFMEHCRKLGVDHFLIVDNNSDDGTVDWLGQQPDVSLWASADSYKMSRFGLDWLTQLQRIHGHGHWCLTLDADEILVYPYWETRNLHALTERLETDGRRSFGTLMLDMYPKGPLSQQHYAAGQDPTKTLNWFDSGNYVVQAQPRMRNLWIQGGVRARSFFGTDPRRAPTLNKVPLVKWDRGYAYVNSTHAILPRTLNAVFDETGGECLSGILLHTKFLPVVIDKSVEEQTRKQHFSNSTLYEGYYRDVIAAPDLWCATSCRYTGWRQLEALGLMSRGGWV